jgi:ElaB/YqjD/DUF883 family membrane-anchored ribosome-binding protein
MKKRTKEEVLADLAVDAKQLVSLRSKLKALKSLEEAAVESIKDELTQLGKEVVEVAGMIVFKEPGESVSLDKALLRKVVGAKVMKECERITEYIKIKVRKSA